MRFQGSTCGWRTLNGSYYVVLVVSVLTSIVTTGGCTHKPAVRSDRAVVSGTVTYQGKPLQGGMLIFISAKDGNISASCGLQEDGTYFVSDAPIGDTKVTIETEALKTGLGPRYMQIPTKYSAPQTSGLTHTVTPGENTANFDLQ